MRAGSLGLALIVVAAGTSTPLCAKDYGKAGSTWSVAEPDLLEVIRSRLQRLQQSGGLAQFQQTAVTQARDAIQHPKPLPGFSHASESKTWTYDPTITIGEDIRDGRGNLIAAKGQKFNPLDHIAMAHDLAFVDGDSRAELDWAGRQGDPQKLWIVMVKGSPIDRMKERQRRFYFDQHGEMTSKFGITHTPALVRQKGAVLEIVEQAINRNVDL
jgi:conjugal transfer pilus assembly protein TraW